MYKADAKRPIVYTFLVKYPQDQELFGSWYGDFGGKSPQLNMLRRTLNSAQHRAH